MGSQRRWPCAETWSRAASTRKNRGAGEARKRKRSLGGVVGVGWSLPRPVPDAWTWCGFAGGRAWISSDTRITSTQTAAPRQCHAGDKPKHIHCVRWWLSRKTSARTRRPREDGLAVRQVCQQAGAARGPDPRTGRGHVSAPPIRPSARSLLRPLFSRLPRSDMCARQSIVATITTPPPAQRPWSVAHDDALRKEVAKFAYDPTRIPWALVATRLNFGHNSGSCAKRWEELRDAHLHVDRGRPIQVLRLWWRRRADRASIPRSVQQGDQSVRPSFLWWWLGWGRVLGEFGRLRFAAATPSTRRRPASGGGSRDPVGRSRGTRAASLNLDLPLSGAFLVPVCTELCARTGDRGPTGRTAIQRVNKWVSNLHVKGARCRGSGRARRPRKGARWHTLSEVNEHRFEQ